MTNRRQLAALHEVDQAEAHLRDVRRTVRVLADDGLRSRHDRFVAEAILVVLDNYLSARERLRAEELIEAAPGRPDPGDSES